MKAFGLINLGILPILFAVATPASAQHDQREQESRRPQQEQQARPERQQQARPERQEQPQRPQQGRPERQEQPQRMQQARPERSQQVRPERPQPQPNPERPQARPRPVKPPEQPKPAIREDPRRPKDLIPDKRPQAASPVRPQAPQRPQGAQAQRPQANRTPQQAQRESANRVVWQERRARNWQAEHRTWQDRGGYRGYRIPQARYRGSFGPSHSFRMFSFPLLVVGGFPRFQYGGLWFSVMDPWPEYWSDDWYGSDDVYIEYWGGGYYLFNRMHPADRIAISVFVG